MTFVNGVYEMMLDTIKGSKCEDTLSSFHGFKEPERLDLWLIANFVGVVEPSRRNKRFNRLLAYL